MGSVLCAPHKLRLGQLLSAVLLHSLSLQLGNASVLGPEDLRGVGLFSHLGGGGFLMLPRVSLCGEKEAENQLPRPESSVSRQELGGLGSDESWILREIQ